MLLLDEVISIDMYCVHFILYFEVFCDNPVLSEKRFLKSFLIYFYKMISFLQMKFESVMNQSI